MANQKVPFGKRGGIIGLQVSKDPAYRLINSHIGYRGHKEKDKEISRETLDKNDTMRLCRKACKRM